MVSTRRRSSRLAAASKTAPGDNVDPVLAQPNTAKVASNHTMSSIAETEDEPMPLAEVTPKPSPSKGPLSFLTAITHRTPKQKTPIKPSGAEMHPAHHQKSTTTPYEEARWLGFFQMGSHTAPAKANPTVVETLAIATPSKATTSNKSRVVGSDFQFTFRRESTVELSNEAQKMMAESREEAKKLRARMAELPPVPDIEPSTTDIVSVKSTNVQSSLATRRIAKPKGKTGRFSDVHMAEFKKMDSISSHPSAWRTDPNRFKNANINHQTAKSLKRSPSKAELDKEDDSPFIKKTPATPNTKPTTAAPSQPATANPRKSLKSPFVSKLVTPQPVTMSQTANSAKRVKHAAGDDASKGRLPLVEITESMTPTTPKSAIPKPSGLAHLLTPTRASLARSKSVQSLRTTKLPMSKLAKSSSVRNLQSLRTPHTPQGQIETKTGKPATPTPVKISDAFKDDAIEVPDELTHSPSVNIYPELPASTIKSILRTPHRLYSDDPAKIAAGTHLATPPEHRNRHLRVPATAPVVKHVDFSASAVAKFERDEAKAASAEPESISYPDLSNTIMEMDSRRSTISSLPIPGAFTFRAPTQIVFTSLPKHQTIRPVRSSDVGVTVPAGSSAASAAKTSETTGSKRKLPSAMPDITEDEDAASLSDKENNRVEFNRPAKRMRKESPTTKPAATAAAVKVATPRRSTIVPKSRLPTSAGAKARQNQRSGGLSAARLHLLAQPKRRG